MKNFWRRNRVDIACVVLIVYFAAASYGRIRGYV
jgi:hypothetical protein